MTTLTSSDIASMRAALLTLMPDAGVISRASEAADAFGGQTRTWATVASSACRVAPETRQPEERETGGALAGVTSYVITFPSGTDVRAQDRVTISGVVYEVSGVRQRGAWEFSRRVIAVKVL